MVHHGVVVNFAQEDLVVGLGVLMQLQFTGHFIRQLSEAANPFPFAKDIGGDSGMQPRYVGSPFYVEGQSQGRSLEYFIDKFGEI